uniref:Uncharacterized protein n=1 Tax=Arundo donax TaxID=35708 RepID=A0A0A9A2F5_ARUDO
MKISLNQNISLTSCP